jgi:D-serine deaminase-like pyridoxal phosphate-dependent protein
MMRPMRTLDELPTPSLLLDLDILEANLARMQALAAAAGVKLRPHVKTHKSPAIARLQQQRGASGFTVSTFHEAAAFARAGFTDLTWALPNPLSRMREVLALLETQPELTLRLLTDDLRAAKMLEDAARPLARKIHVFIKIDCGYHRAGIDPHHEDALRLADYLENSSMLIFDGILTHPGHSYHAQNREQIRAIAASEREIMLQFAERCRARGIPVREISIGSTPTLSVTAPHELEGITEIRPGNYVFYDYTQSALGSCGIKDCALTVLSSVISHQKNAHWFVTDAGALSLSKDSGPDHLPNEKGLGFIFDDYPNKHLARGVHFEQLSQEHGIVRGTPGELGPYPVGARVRVLSVHSCLTAASFDLYQVVRGDRVLEEWPIARAH